MRTYNTIVLLLFFCLFLACSSEDEEEVVEPEFFFNTSSTEYNYDECFAEFKGRALSSSTATEWGFVYSYENEIPTFDDVRVVLGTSVNRANFSITVEDYVFSRTLFWRPYAIINGETLFETPRQFVEDYNIENLSTLEISFDCLASERELLINQSLICPSEPVNIEVCITAQQLSNCQEFPITNDEYTVVPLDEDVLDVDVSLIEIDEPRSRFFTQRVRTSRQIQSIEQQNMPLAVAESTGFRIGDSFYLCGGYTESDSTFVSDFWRYSFRSGEWSQLEDFPGGQRGFLFSAVVGDNAYLGTGGSQTEFYSDFYSFNISSNTWRQLEPLPFPGIAGVSFVLNNKIYVTNLLLGERNISELLFEYDIESNRWQRRGFFPIAFTSARNMAVAYDGKGYLVSTNRNHVEIFQYTDVSDQWNMVAEYPISCNDGVAVVDDGILYITTGRGMEGVYALDLTTFEAQLICTPPQDQRSEAVGTIYDGEIFIFGGLEDDLDGTVFRTLSTVYSMEL